MGKEKAHVEDRPDLYVMAFSALGWVGLMWWSHFEGGPMKRVQLDTTTHGPGKAEYIEGVVDSRPDDSHPGHPVTGDARCEYCGLWGKRGRCNGCGAPHA